MDRCEHCGSNLHCACINNATLIDNSVLAYCQSFIKNHDVNTVAKALENYFEEQDLFSARQLLRNKFSEMLQGMDIIKVKQRTSSSLRVRSSCNAIAQDIAEAVYKLSDHVNAPTFIVSDLRKLPILQPKPHF